MFYQVHLNGLTGKRYSWQYDRADKVLRRIIPVCFQWKQYICFKEIVLYNLLEFLFMKVIFQPFSLLRQNSDLGRIFSELVQDVVKYALCFMCL